MSRHSTRKLSVAIGFFNMRREAERTLFSLTPAYQQGVDPATYEVIAIDNGSSQPLDPSWVTSFGANFRYSYHETRSKSPCGAINRAVQAAESQLVMCLIDGARILSPKIVKYSLLVSEMYAHPFIYTLGMHLGVKPQNLLVSEGYRRTDEDRLLESVNWKSNGYRLFDVSSVALSSKGGFFSELTETNCFTMNREDFLDLGGYDERFASPGGGLANLDLFNRVHEDERFSPVMLLGEATFHQLHGGVATNVPLEEHPWNTIEREYTSIRGKRFVSSFRFPEYYGSISVESRPFLKGDDRALRQTLQVIGRIRRLLRRFR